MNNIVIVGASLAGLHAAVELRRLGYDGRLTLVGGEAHMPYDRPPLSKKFLTGKIDSDATRLDVPDDLGAEWRLGTRATALELNTGRVCLDSGEELPFDGLVVATGVSPRTLEHVTGGWGAAEGVHVLRNLDDASMLRADLRRGPRLVVIGAGFIGLEAAASARALDLDVTVIETLPVPLERAIGSRFGIEVAALHRRHDTKVLLGTDIDKLVGAERVEGVRLATGVVIAADTVLVGVGVTPETAWLEGSGLDLDNGVVCDECLRARSGGSARPDIVVAGDVARWPHPRYGDVRVEHWTNAVEQGEAAARTLISGDDAVAFAPVPYFWSDQYDTKIQFVGRTRPGDDVTIVDGAPDEPRWAAAFGRDGRVVAGLGFARPAKIMGLLRLIGEDAPYPPR